MCPIKLQHVQLLGRPTGALAQPRSNPADVCNSPRKACNVTRQIFRRLFPAGHETNETHDEPQETFYVAITQV